MKTRIKSVAAIQTKFLLVGLLLFSTLIPLVKVQLAHAAPTALNTQYEERTVNGEIDINNSAIGPDSGLYQVGSYQGTIDFDPTSGQDMSSDSDSNSGIIRSFHANGTYDDTRVLSSNDGSVYVNSIVFNADKGEYYITGMFHGEVDFDFSSGTEVLEASGNYGNAFVARYNSADDSLDEVRAIVGSGEGHDSYIAGVALNPDGPTFAVYGSFEVDADLDMSSGGEDTYSTSSYEAAFISTYDFDFNYIQSNVYDLDENEARAEIYAAAYSGNGYLYYSVDVYNHGDEDDDFVLDTDLSEEGTHEVTFPLGSEGSGTVIIKTSDDGATYEDTWELLSSPGDYNYGDYIWVSKIVVHDNDVYYAGEFEGSVDLNPHGEQNDNYNSTNGAGFVTKINDDESYGYSYVQRGTDTSSGFYDLVVGPGGVASTLGGISILDGATTTDINPGEGTNSKYIQDDHSILVQLNASGEQVFGYVSGSSNSQSQQVGDYGRTLALDGSGNIYTTSGVFYQFQEQDSDSCEINDEWLYGTGTAKFAATGANVSGWSDFSPVPNSYVEGCDGDGDGISDSDENAGPNGGDADNDGTPDYMQSSVAVLKSVDDKTVVAALSGDDCGFTTITLDPEADLDSQDANFSYVAGLVNFTAECEDEGATATVELYYYDTNSDGLSLRKYNSVTNAYTAIEDALISEETIDSRTVTIATYDVTDGGLYDEDGEVNATIVDPSGLASVAAALSGGSQSGGSSSPSGLAGTGQSSATAAVVASILILGSTSLVVVRKRIAGKR